MKNGFIKVNGAKAMPQADHDLIIKLSEEGKRTYEIARETGFPTLKVNAVLRTVNKNIRELLGII